MFTREVIESITCDFCSNNSTYGWIRQKEAIEDARQEGWSIGKKVKCPECKDKRDLHVIAK